MYTLLRKIAEWKARRRAAQIIVFDGGSEVEKTRAFLKGAVTGVAFTLGAFLLTAPTSTDPQAVEELRRRDLLLETANRQVEQAVAVASMCLNTAEDMEKTIDSYSTFLKKSSVSR